MMRVFVLLLLGIVVLFGCARARVDVGGTEKPIKVDVTMRVDIYQHVVKQADDIENMVRGTEEPKSADKPQSFLRVFVGEAWAGELNPITEKAISGRKSRLTKVNELLANGTLGENNQGLLTLRKDTDEAKQVSADENADRKIIYADLAKQNNVPISEIQAIYAEKMQSLAPAGSSTQDKNGNWIKK